VSILVIDQDAFQRATDFTKGLTKKRVPVSFSALCTRPRWDYGFEGYFWRRIGRSFTERFKS
jgi:hypothetical protein